MQRVLETRTYVSANLCHLQGVHSKVYKNFAFIYMLKISHIKIRNIQIQTYKYEFV
jgi:hypothetical protein